MVGRDCSVRDIGNRLFGFRRQNTESSTRLDREGWRTGTSASNYLLIYQLSLAVSLKVEVKNKALIAADVHVYRWSTIHPVPLVTRNTVHGRCVAVTHLVRPFYW